MSDQDVDWSSVSVAATPITNAPVLLPTVIEVFERFGYKLGQEWPSEPILVFRKSGEPPIRIAGPDFRSAHDGRPCYDRDIVFDMWERTLVKGDIDGGIQLRMVLKEQLTGKC